MFAATGHALIFSGLRRALALPGSLQRIVPRWQHLEKRNDEQETTQRRRQTA